MHTPLPSAALQAKAQCELGARQEQTVLNYWSPECQANGPPAGPGADKCGPMAPDAGLSQ